MSIQLGSVFECGWSSRPIRVLMCDDIEVLYDSWWDHLNEWGLSSLKGNATYYRVRTASLAGLRPIRIDALSEQELSFHRPDLPLRLGRSRKMNWSCEKYSEIDSFGCEVKGLDLSLFEEMSRMLLRIQKIALCPFGPKGGFKGGVVVEAQDKEGFSGLELLWQAHRVQSQLLKCSEICQGVGLYRSGFKRGIPSYYIWGNVDKANFCEESSK